MCDCFPQSEGSISVRADCKGSKGISEYAGNYKKWSKPVISLSFAPENAVNGSGDIWKQKYTYSKGPRFGVAPSCDCTPPEERFRFETTYDQDYTQKMHEDERTRRNTIVPGARRQDIVLPRQHLCPFTTETTYARSFDMNQANFQQNCLQDPSDKGYGCSPCDENNHENPAGITISFSPATNKRRSAKLKKENLIKPGTDTSRCCKCPKEMQCCPCPTDANLCDACCGCEYPCKLHMAAATPTRKYPIALNTPRYVPDPRDPPRRPLLLCRGGTLECPLQNEFPTAAATAQAKQRLLEKLEEERCRFPPECVESTYRGSFKVPPVNLAPKYCSKEQRELKLRADAEVAAKGVPGKCLPTYCLDGGRPPDPRPLFDHLSTYEADYVWSNPQRFKLLGGEIPCKFELKPICAPKVVDAREIIKERTEEKERWGEDWEYCPEP